MLSIGRFLEVSRVHLGLAATVSLAASQPSLHGGSRFHYHDRHDRHDRARRLCGRYALAIANPALAGA